MSRLSPRSAVRAGSPFVLALALVGSSVVAGGAGPASAAEPHTADLHTADLRGTTSAAAIAGRYIVVLKAPATGAGNLGLDAAVDRAQDAGADVTSKYGRALNGYAATMTAAELTAARQDPAVAYVEADQRVRTTGTRVAASWGQDRIDARAGLDHTISTTGDGSGVTAYVIDTGVRATDQDFGGRVSSGYTAVPDGLGTDDCNGHGTHVAGTIGSATYGVAPAVSIVAVRVLGCDGSGSTSGVIAGIEWVTAHHTSPAVANLSLDGSALAALDSAVQASIASGVTYAIAAGNESGDACDDSPARVGAALTVGASTRGDLAADFSNYGSCVDLYAPGDEITSTWNTSNTSTAVLSGTSMASPHVAGAAALYLQAHPGAPPAQVTAAIIADATPGVLDDVPAGTANLLLHVPGPDSPATTTPTTPSTPEPTTSPPPAPVVTGSPCHSTRLTGSLTKRTTLTTDKAFTTHSRGTIYGCLSGPARADFDLYLMRWTGSRWALVSGSYGSTSKESVRYPAPAGRYRWQVVSAAGTGRYVLKVTQPA